MLIFLFVACATMHPPVASAAPAPMVVSAPEAVAPVGSLWSDVQGRQMIGMDNNTRRIGDLITVQIDESAATSLGATTNASRATGAGFSIESLFGVETAITKANPNMGAGLSLAGQSESSTDGSGTTTRNGTLQAVITCQVVEVLANGNLRLRGTKEVRVNRETQYITLEGVVRPRDIRLDNTVTSNLLAEPRIGFEGQGILANQQGQGWGTAIANTVWPF
jgi:flagellar L-ring protein precursor FlgH